MKKNLQVLAAITTYVCLMSASVLAEQAQDEQARNKQTVQNAELEKGKNIAFNRRKGNCLACHYIEGGTLMGNTGPGLIAMKQRFPEREKLVAQITDARTNNKNTFMPPFGAHGILTEQEVELVVDWLYTL